jgi:glycosyltransferase involved in cell wall biosynthesis
MSELGVIDRFRILGHIPRMDQLQLMRASIAVIQPSRFEGWSTVVEDARALGKPILLSDFPVHREQDPNGARFFPLQDAGALAQAISEAADLPAGPDPENEAAARRDTAVRVAAFGRGFLAIARRVSTG